MITHTRARPPAGQARSPHRPPTAGAA